MAVFLDGIGDNGLTDNLASFNSQLASLALGGAGEVILPHATGYYGVSGDLVIPQGVILRGEGPALLKGPGTSGTITFGSGIGPYIGGLAFSWNKGVVCLTHPGSAIDNLVVIGINNTNATTRCFSAPVAIYVGGTGISNAPRIRHCSGWGATVSVLKADIGSDDLVVLDTELNNNTFTFTGGTASVGATVAGACVWVTGSDDHRFIGVQSFDGAWQIGNPPTALAGGNNFMAVGCHMSSAPANFPTLYLSSATGGMFTDCTFDNAQNKLLAHVRRAYGTWAFRGCRFQNGLAGTGNNYPVFQDDIGSGTGADLTHGLLVTGCHVSRAGSGVPFTGLVNFAGTGTLLRNPYDLFDSVEIDDGALTAPTSLWLANGFPTTTVLPGLAHAILYGGVLQAEIAGTNISSGTGSAALGSNCPASNLGHPHTWIQTNANDGTVVYIPVWK